MTSDRVTTALLAERPEDRVSGGAVGDGWLHSITDFLARIPSEVWAYGTIAVLLAALVALPIARRQARKAGERAGGKTVDESAEKARRERTFLIASMVPAVLFWLAVVAGSFRGLTAFARDELGWHDGWDLLVPFTLDGVAVAFGFLAFRAVKKRRSPDRSNRVVWGAALASAGINFFHEIGLPEGSGLGGAYLALLSVFGMVMFHEFLDQFTEGTEWIKREFPAFKLRWITWPTNTICAWFAWRNYPPAPETLATVAEAVRHLDKVREAKSALRRQRTDATWMSRINPWRYSADLNKVIAEQRVTLAAEQRHVAELAEIAKQRAEQMVEAERRYAEIVAEAERITAESAELRAERDRMQETVDFAERTAAAVRRDAVEEAERLRSEHAEQIARIRSEQRERAERANGARPANGTRTGKQSRTDQPNNAPKLTDDEAVDLMLRTHPERGYEWSSREVHRITGAGFGRIPKLTAMVAERHSKGANSSHDDSADDADAERSHEPTTDLIGATA